MKANFKRIALGVSSLASVGVLAGLPATVGAQSTSGAQTFKANLTQLNKSGSSGTATIVLNGDTAQINANVTGVLANAPHAQHLHWAADASHTCPSATAQTNGGLLTTADAIPQYGAVDVSLTTSGDTSANSALAVKRFPTPTNSSYSYSRTITLTSAQVQHLTSGQYVFVVHGVDGNNDGKYDGSAKSSLDKSLPLEATAPTACGVVEAASTTIPSSSTGTAMTDSNNSSNNHVATDVALGLGALGTLLGVVALATAGKKSV